MTGTELISNLSAIGAFVSPTARILNTSSFCGIAG
jgi:hypothetical protein